MKKNKWLKWVLAIISVIMLISLAIPLMKGESPVRFGLDIAGGIVVAYRPDYSRRLDSYSKTSEKELLKLCKEILTDRLYRKLNAVPDINIRSDGRIIVSIPSVQNYHEVLDIVGQTYLLTMRLALSSYDSEQPDKKLFYYGGRYHELSQPIFSGDMLNPESIKVVPGNAQMGKAPSVAFSFKDPYDKKFEEFTRNNTNRSLAILLDEKIEVLANIRGTIEGTAELTGNYTPEEARDHTIMLRSGNLPIPLKIESLSSIGPSLGQDVKESGFKAMLLSIFLLLILIIIAYIHRSWFLFAGMISIFCLAMTIISLVSLFRLTLDFGGIAGIILSIGMGMDAFIIIAESLESKLKQFSTEQISRHVDLIIREIYSFSGDGRVLFHANAAILITIFLLINSDRVGYFALTVLIGVFSSIFTILVTREVLRFTYGLAPNFGPSLLGWLRGRKLGIFRIVKPYLAMSTVAFAVACYLLYQSYAGKQYIKFGTDFQPGTQIVCEASDNNKLKSMIEEISSIDNRIGVTYQNLYSVNNSNTNRYLVNIGVPLALKETPEAPVKNDEKKENAPEQQLPDFGAAPVAGNGTKNGNETKDNTAKGPSLQENNYVDVMSGPGKLTPELLSTIFSKHDVALLSVNSIDSKVSSSRYVSGMSVLLISFGLLVIYFLFLQKPLDLFFMKKKQENMHAPGSHLWISSSIILALVHDVSFILLGCYLLKIDFSLAVLAGILTTLGYSVNDSIVLWVHIQNRSNILKEKNMSPGDIVSSSIDSIFSRSALTSASTILPALAILLMNITPLVEFAWVMLFGTLAGALSTFYIVGAGALMTISERKPVTAAVPGIPDQDRLSEVEFLNKLKNIE